MLCLWLERLALDLDAQRSTTIVEATVLCKRYGRCIAEKLVNYSND